MPECKVIYEKSTKRKSENHKKKSELRNLFQEDFTNNSAMECFQNSRKCDDLPSDKQRNQPSRLMPNT